LPFTEVNTLWLYPGFTWKYLVFIDVHSLIQMVNILPIGFDTSPYIVINDVAFTMHYLQTWMCLQDFTGFLVFFSLKIEGTQTSPLVLLSKRPSKRQLLQSNELRLLLESSTGGPEGRGLVMKTASNLGRNSQEIWDMVDIQAIYLVDAFRN
jgi:hypothetical protein